MRVTIDVRNPFDRATGLGKYLRRTIESMTDLDPALKLELWTGREHGKLDLDGQSGNLPHRSSALPNRLFDGNFARLSVPFCRWYFRGTPVLHQMGIAPMLPVTRGSITTVHDILPITRPDVVSESFRKWFERDVVPSWTHVSHFVCSSEHTRREMVEVLGIAEQRTSVIPLGCDPVELRPHGDPRDVSVLSKLGVNQPYVFWIGRVSPRKNLARLARAFAAGTSAAEVRGWRFVMAGCDDESIAAYPELRQELDRLGDAVTLIGKVSEEELAVLLRQCEIFAFPSLCEGFGLPALEAMSAGAPVLASACYSLPEVVGDAGILVEPTDEEALAAALARLMQDDALRRSLGEAAAARARTMTWTHTAAATLALYRRLA